MLNNLHSYSYMLGISVDGIGYTLLQTIAFVMFWIVMNNDKGLTLFEFYGDKVVSYLLATAAGVGIGASIDFKDLVDGKFSMSYYNDEFVSAGKLSTTYYNNGLVSAGSLLLAIVCTASLSIMSSYALQKKV
uniref:CASP-like protein n=1 Tax=Quercus lobata TaxID=97700 RepID=A0A7N2LH90_QUELO